MGLKKINIWYYLLYLVTCFMLVVTNAGISQRLVCLDGTIPVNYKDTYYLIPICIWLMLEHPFLPPMVYVNPTDNMQLTPGPYLDTSGQVTIAYLDNWNKDNSDLSGLVQILCAVFAEQIPVYTKPPRKIPQAGPSVGELVHSDSGQTRTGRFYSGSTLNRMRAEQVATSTRQVVTDGTLSTKGSLQTISKSSHRPEDQMKMQPTYSNESRISSDVLRKRRDALLSSINDVIAKAKTLQEEAESIVNILETSKPNLMKEPLCVESLSSIEPILEGASRWQARLRHTSKEVGGETEDIINQIEDYQLLMRRGEPRPTAAGNSYKDWSTDDVCLWFDSIGFGEYIPFIKEHKLRGIHLPELSKDDMIELGIKKLGDRITIDGEINKLCYKFSNIL